MEQACMEFLKQRGALVKSDWLQQCLQFIEMEVGPAQFRNYTQDRVQKLVYEQFLHADLNLIGVGLEQEIATLHDFYIHGPTVIQIDEIVDISEPTQNQIVSTFSEDDISSTTNPKPTAANSNRTLKFSCTDGKQRIIALEYALIPALSPDTRPGCKICIKEVLVRRGLLLLMPQTVNVLGGDVEELVMAANAKREILAKRLSGKSIDAEIQPSKLRKTEITTTAAPVTTTTTTTTIIRPTTTSTTTATTSTAKTVQTTLRSNNTMSSNVTTAPRSVIGARKPMATIVRTPSTSVATSTTTIAAAATTTASPAATAATKSSTTMNTYFPKDEPIDIDEFDIEAEMDIALLPEEDEEPMNTFAIDNADEQQQKQQQSNSVHDQYASDEPKTIRVSEVETLPVGTAFTVWGSIIGVVPPIRYDNGYEVEVKIEDGTGRVIATLPNQLLEPLFGISSSEFARCQKQQTPADAQLMRESASRAQRGLAEMEGFFGMVTRDGDKPPLVESLTNEPSQRAAYYNGVLRRLRRALL